MKFLLLSTLMISGVALAQDEAMDPNLGDVAPTTTTRGLDVEGTGTLSPEPYPSSGTTRARSNDMLGKDLTSMEQSSSELQEDAETPAGGVSKQDATLDIKDGYVDRVADIPTDSVFEMAMALGTTQTGPYDVTGEEQAQQAEVEREENDDIIQEPEENP